MDDRSWFLLDDEDPRFRLPDDLRARDAFAARDIGWVEQMRPFVRQFSYPGESVLDPFAGFATTLVAAQLEGRRALGYEIDAQRVAIARERLARLRLDASGLRHGAIEPALRDPDRVADVDLCLTSAPYFGTAARLVSGLDSAQQYASTAYRTHLDGLGEIFHRVRQRLHAGRYCIVFAENLNFGGRMLAFAWDLAAVLGSLFEACDERVLVYPRPGSPAPPLAAGSNRAHEYALVFRKHARPCDALRTVTVLQTLVAQGFAFVVHGSFAGWWRSQVGSPPQDVDLLFDASTPHFEGAAAWLTQHGFQLRSWGQALTLPLDLASLAQRHSIRAEQIDRAGNHVRIDLGFSHLGDEFANRLRQCDWVRGLPLDLD